MHYLSMFIVVLQYNVYCYYCGVFIEKYVCTKFHRNRLLCELHGCYCNVLPEAVYCCFTRTTLFTKFFNQSLRLLSYHQAFLLYTLWFQRYNIAKCIA